MANPTEAQRIVLQQAMEIVDYGAAQGSLNSGSKTETPHEGTSGVTDHDLLGGDLFGGDLLGGRSDTAPTGSGRRSLSHHRGRSDTAPTGSGRRTLSLHRGRSDTATTGSGKRSLSHHRGRSDTATTGSGKRSLSHHRGRSDTATTGSGKRSLSHHRELLLGGSSDTATTSSGRRTLHDRLLGSRSDTATTSSGRRTVSHVNIKSGGIAKLLSTTTRRCHGKYPLTQVRLMGISACCFCFFKCNRTIGSIGA